MAKISSFSLADFVQSPSLELLDSCRVKDLCDVAAHFNIQVPGQILKNDLRVLIARELTDIGVLVGSGVDSPADGVTPPGAMGTCGAGSPRGATKGVPVEETERNDRLS